MATIGSGVVTGLQAIGLFAIHVILPASWLRSHRRLSAVEGVINHLLGIVCSGHG